MKTYSRLILESTLNKNQFIHLLSSLDKFITYKVGLFYDINRLLEINSSPKNVNNKYQLPLYYLFKTGKYSDIIKNGDIFYTNKLSNVSCVFDENGNWHPVNKLNTNYADQSELLYDLFNKLNIYNEIPTEPSKLKEWLIQFKTDNDLYTLIKDNLDFKYYTNYNRKFTEIGEIAENRVKEFLIDKGCEILYQGGDGDFIDMIYGVDLIVKKDEKIYTIQVKSKEKAAKKSLEDSINQEDSMYKKIDWFCTISDSNNIKIFTKKNPNGKEFF